MVPSIRMLALAAAWLFLAAGAVAAPGLVPLWQWLGLAAGLVVIVDVMWLRCLPQPEIRRRLPGRLAVGEPGEVELTVVGPGGGPAVVEVFDGIPAGAVTEMLPWSGVVPPRRAIQVIYAVKVLERGEVVFGPLHLRRRSPLGLWWRQTTHLAPETVRVYPNYEPVIRFSLLAMQHRENPLGIVRRPRGGSSRDFHQLRDYRDGDPFSQIDWKATSRRQMLISRDYQEQRNQSIVFLLDTGRRMRALEDGVAQFDHVLNSVLLVAHMALGQGDQVAVKSFGGLDRWLPPLKGSHAMPVLLNHLYDYQTTAAPSDFAKAVEQLMTRQRRRSLVILLTNLRGEDGKELLPAMQVLNTRHLVLVASMCESAVREAFSQPVTSFPAALRFLAADRYAQERREVLAGLTAAGIHTLDTNARELPVALANQYLAIKAAGRL